MSENVGDEVDEILNFYRDHGSFTGSSGSCFGVTAEIGGGDGFVAP